MTALTATASSVHHPIGKPGGPGLFHVAGLQLPAYIQNLRDGLMKHGHSESQATQMAIGIVRDWAEGHDGHGNKVSAEVQAAAVKAVAEYDAARARAKVSRSVMDTMTSTVDADGLDASRDGAARKTKGGMRRFSLARYCPVEDIHIMRTGEGDGSGRVVEAYAAVFDQPAGIRDGQGHYEELIDRGAFDEWLASPSRRRSVRVLYNHGKTMEGIPAPEFQRPLGKPLEIVPDSRGLLTRTEYKRSPLADEILDDIKEGRITAQSFEGPDIRSDPPLRGPGAKYRSRNGVLQRVRRMAVGLQNYGPALFAAYQGAEFLGVRMSILGGDDDDFDLPGFEDETSATEEVLTGLPPEDGTSARYHQHALYVMRSREAREAKGITW